MGKMTEARTEIHDLLLPLGIQVAQRASALLVDSGYLDRRDAARAPTDLPDAELVELSCEVMHDAYEAAAVGAGWETQQASRKPWADVPEANKATMRAAVGALIAFLDGTDPTDDPDPGPGDVPDDPDTEKHLRYVQRGTGRDRWRWTLTGGNGEPMCNPGEKFSSKSNARRSAAASLGLSHRTDIVEHLEPST